MCLKPGFGIGKYIFRPVKNWAFFLIDGFKMAAKKEYKSSHTYIIATTYFKVYEEICLRGYNF